MRKLINRWNGEKPNPTIVAWLREQALAGKHDHLWRPAEEGDEPKCYQAMEWSVEKGTTIAKDKIPPHCLVDIPTGSLVNSCWRPGEEIECFECACVSDEEVYTERMMEAVYYWADSGRLAETVDAVLSGYVPLPDLINVVEGIGFLKEDVQGQIAYIEEAKILTQMVKKWEPIEEWQPEETKQRIAGITEQVRKATVLCNGWRTDSGPLCEYTLKEAAIYLKFHEEYYPDGPAVPYLRFLVQQPEPLRTAG